MLPSFEQLKSIIIPAAQEELLPRFAKVKRAEKADGSFLTEADLAIQARIQAALQTQWPQYAFLGEEMSEDEQRHVLAHSDSGAWCLDPLDGTSNFAAGVPYFGVSLSLIIKGEIVLGMVYDPNRDECFYAQQGQGAFLNETRLNVRPQPNLSKSTALIDFKRLTPELATRLVTEIPYGSQRSFGSVALDWCWMATGRCHVYLHGKQNIWDYSAGYLIMHEAGGQSCTLDGDDVFVPQLQARSAVAALDPELYQAWIDYLGITPKSGKT